MRLEIFLIVSFFSIHPVWLTNIFWWYSVFEIFQIVSFFFNTQSVWLTFYDEIWDIPDYLLFLQFPPFSAANILWWGLRYSWLSLFFNFPLLVWLTFCDETLDIPDCLFFQFPPFSVANILCWDLRYSRLFLFFSTPPPACLAFYDEAWGIPDCLFSFPLLVWITFYDEILRYSRLSLFIFQLPPQRG